MFKFPKHPEQKRKQSGFTLIELAIIMAIIAILGAVGAVKFASMKDEANAAAEASALANARSALAIAVAKDKDGVITLGEFSTYLEGAVTGTLAASSETNSLTWTPKTGGTAFTVVVSTDANTSISSVTSVKKV